MSETKFNSGVLFKNEKRTKDTHPTHNGNCVIHCPNCNRTAEFWLSAWVKEAKTSGRKFFSLAFKPKEDPGAYKPPTTPTTTATNTPPPDDDVPF